MSFAPRYCYLEKGERGYGFNLHGEAPESNEEPISPHRTFYHVIKAVDAKSPAQYGGLKQDDRLIGVNGYYVDNKPHLDVVNLIKRGGSSAWLLVVDREADEHFYSQMKRKPAFADAVYGQQDKRGEPVDLSSVPMEEERETVESGEGEEELAAPPPDYPGNAEDSEEEARENEEAINAVVSAVEDKEESSEREANDAQSSHNTSSHSAQGSQEDKENRASAADQQRIQRQLRNLDMASKLGVKVVHPVPESFRYNNNKNNIRKNSKQQVSNDEEETTSNKEEARSSLIGYDQNVEVEVTTSDARGSTSSSDHQQGSTIEEVGASSSNNIQYQPDPPQESQIQNSGGGVLSLDMQSARSMVKANRHQAKEAPGSWKNKWADFNRL